MPKSDADKAGANGGANDDSKAGKNTDDANRNQRGKAGDDANDDDGQDGTGEGGKKKAGKVMTDDEINEIVQRRLKRATKDAEEKAQLSKEELLQRERDDARNELRVSNARDAFITATKIDYGKASRLFRMYKDEIEFDDNGKPTNLADVIKTAKSEWSDLFKPEKPGAGDLGDGNDDDGKSTSGGMNQRLRNATGRGQR
jgi:hypothetical protein